ncbi:aspartate aminotransferase family protein [Dongia soli]|uniref:Aspartate aminotransferase family protein n=1 Tax=Dongia soli TaxID=600628 RepID=A0ABU5E891_9PROT|nr:aspartate aminotransferase family protein [Dongia soli]MDY0882512.1 aspartate aminotransferase family protein [Dongia soli]
MANLEAGVSTDKVTAMIRRESDHYTQRNPTSQRFAREAASHWHNGVPMHWMLDWSTPFPLFVADASGSTLTDVDGHKYDDFCLGDTGSMFGHSPAPVAAAIAEQARHGLTYMLPTEDVVEVGKLLTAKFGLPYWQVATTATDANRFVIRWCRGITKRNKILVFHGCYHGSCDDTFVRLKDGKPIHRPGLIGQVYDLTTHTKVVEFNDLPALETALKDRDVACVITEPALTNIGMVLPQPGYLEGLRQLTRKYGTLLVIDETHTISTGYGGYTRTHRLEPDFLTIGKPIAGGIPCSVYGCTAEMAAKMKEAETASGPGYSGMGTTLSANAMALKAMRANLEQVMTLAAYEHMLPLSERLARGIEAEIRKRNVPWHVSNVGARAEFVCAPERPRNGTEAQAAMHHKVELAIHLYLLNRGIIIAPFHNMTLVCPATTAAQVDHLIASVGACIDELQN